MKNLTILLICIQLAITSYPQSTPEPAQRRTIFVTFPVYETDIKGKNFDPDKYYSAPVGYDLTVIREAESNSNYFVIEFPLFEKGSGSDMQGDRFYRFNYEKEAYEKSRTPGVNAETSEAEGKKYFMVLKSDLEKNTKVRYRRWKSAEFTAGALTIPIKLRLENFDFGGNISLGVNGGVRWRISRYNEHYFSILLGGNIGAVDLDSFTTKGRVVGEKIKNIAIFSPSLGIVFEFKGLQAGFIFGMDYLSKENQVKYDWIYQGKPWIGFGFGIALFGNARPTEPKSAPKESTQKDRL